MKRLSTTLMGWQTSQPRAKNCSIEEAMTASLTDIPPRALAPPSPAKNPCGNCDTKPEGGSCATRPGFTRPNKRTAGNSALISAAHPACRPCGVIRSRRALFPKCRSSCGSDRIGLPVLFTCMTGGTAGMTIAVAVLSTRGSCEGGAHESARRDDDSGCVVRN